MHDVHTMALQGKNAHLSAKTALEGLKIDITGRKILNTPYTIWQLITHINYWQDKWLARLNGEVVPDDNSWKIGWKDELNAGSQKELDAEIAKMMNGIDMVNEILKNDTPVSIEVDDKYSNYSEVIQAMASHLSYHIGELILLRRIFGAWPPQSGSYVW